MHLAAFDAGRPKSSFLGAGMPNDHKAHVPLHLHRFNYGPAAGNPQLEVIKREGSTKFADTMQSRHVTIRPSPGANQRRDEEPALSRHQDARRLSDYGVSVAWNMQNVQTEYAGEDTSAHRQCRNVRVQDRHVILELSVR